MIHPPKDNTNLMAKSKQLLAHCTGKPVDESRRLSLGLPGFTPNRDVQPIPSMYLNIYLHVVGCLW